MIDMPWIGAMGPPAILIAYVLISHFGIRLAGYNRVNSLGWRRRTIKRVEKAMFAETWLTPIGIGWFYGDRLWDVASSPRSMGTALSMLPVGLLFYGGVCCVLGTVLFALWLTWRPIFGVQHADVRRRCQLERAERESANRFARTKRCRLAARIPGNEIFDLAIEEIDIAIANLPTALEGYKIAHLSDIHLTGHFQPDYMNRVIERATDWRPEMFALTGDIVDVPLCIDWLPNMFRRAAAADGCYFVLGNHDTRIADPNRVRRAMEAAGWIDVGGAAVPIRMRDQGAVMLGNEWPWFDRPADEEVFALAIDGAADGFRLCLSHSPDQFDWARRHAVDLMLCGHTHGGQGRLPLAGPILSPSWHGSRWASGDFYRKPTTMHVSRGLGAVHLLRIRCPPELSLIRLVAKES